VKKERDEFNMPPLTGTRQGASWKRTIFLTLALGFSGWSADGWLLGISMAASGALTGLAAGLAETTFFED
jgi:hypothetical protein